MRLPSLSKSTCSVGQPVPCRSHAARKVPASSCVSVKSLCGPILRTYPMYNSSFVLRRASASLSSSTQQYALASMLRFSRCRFTSQSYSAAFFSITKDRAVAGSLTFRQSHTPPSIWIFASSKVRFMARSPRGACPRIWNIWRTVRGQTSLWTAGPSPPPYTISSRHCRA